MSLSDLDELSEKWGGKPDVADPRTRLRVNAAAALAQGAPRVRSLAGISEDGSGARVTAANDQHMASSIEQARSLAAAGNEQVKAEQVPGDFETEFGSFPARLPVDEVLGGLNYDSLSDKYTAAFFVKD